MVSSNMEFLGKVMQWNLRYMHVVMDLKSKCSFLFLFYVQGCHTWYISFYLNIKFGYSSKWTSACGSAVTFTVPVNRLPTDFSFKTFAKLEEKNPDLFESCPNIGLLEDMPYFFTCICILLASQWEGRAYLVYFIIVIRDACQKFCVGHKMRKAGGRHVYE